MVPAVVWLWIIWTLTIFRVHIIFVVLDAIRLKISFCQNIKAILIYWFRKRHADIDEVRVGNIWESKIILPLVLLVVFNVHPSCGNGWPSVASSGLHLNLNDSQLFIRYEYIKAGTFPVKDVAIRLRLPSSAHTRYLPIRPISLFVSPPNWSLPILPYCYDSLDVCALREPLEYNWPISTPSTQVEVKKTPSPPARTERPLRSEISVKSWMSIDASLFLVHAGGHRVVVTFDLSRKVHSEKVK